MLNIIKHLRSISNCCIFTLYLKPNKMNTVINRFGEIQTDWTSHKHPDNKNFMQLVKFMHIQYADGRNNLYWRLFNSSANDKHIIPNITVKESLEKYVDIDEKELTDADFEKWLSERK